MNDHSKNEKLQNAISRLSSKQTDLCLCKQDSQQMHQVQEAILICLIAGGDFSVTTTKACYFTGSCRGHCYTSFECTSPIPERFSGPWRSGCQIFRKGPLSEK